MEPSELFSSLLQNISKHTQSEKGQLCAGQFKFLFGFQSGGGGRTRTYEGIAVSPVAGVRMKYPGIVPVNQHRTILEFSAFQGASLV
jgi:hypothetical protein